MLNNTDRQQVEYTGGHGEDKSSWLEIYESPADCGAAELAYHFSRPPYSAECKTPISRMRNSISSTFVLEFSTSDVGKIMERPVQLLDEEDPSSEIKISRLEVRRCTQVLVTCEHEMSSRMIKSYFKKFGEIENCYRPPFSNHRGDYQTILTFKDSSSTQKVASTPTHHVTKDLTIHTELLKDGTDKFDEPSSPSGTSFTFNFDMDSVSSTLPPYKPGSNDSTHSLKFDGSEFSHDDATRNDAKWLTLNIKHQRQNCDSSNICDSQSLKLNEMSNPPVSTLSLQTAMPPLPPPLPLRLSAPRLSNKKVPIQSASTAKEVHVLPVPHTKQVLVPSTQLAKPEPVPPASRAKLAPVPTVNLQGCIQVNNCIMRLVRGDLSQHAADVLVHSLAGYASEMLYRKCCTSSTSIEDIGTVKIGEEEKISITTAPNLPAKYLFGFQVTHENYVGILPKFLKSCLQICEILNVKSIAFPALGTGCCEGSPSAMSMVLIKSILEYMMTQDQSRLEIIDIVVYQHHMVKDYKASLKNSVNFPKQAGATDLPKGLNVKVAKIDQVRSESYGQRPGDR